jgi:quercetin 2,3-dioxygenase
VSNLDVAPPVIKHGGRGDVPIGPVNRLIAGRTTTLGNGTEVRRVLPTLGRRTSDS